MRGFFELRFGSFGGEGGVAFAWLFGIFWGFLCGRENGGVLLLKL